MRLNDTVLVGGDWVLVESDLRARVTLVPTRDVWLTYYSAERSPPLHTMSIKLPAQSRSTFGTRSAEEGIWLRTDDAGSISVSVDRVQLI